MKFSVTSLVVIASLAAAILLGSAASAQTPEEQLAAFYTREFREFNAAFKPLVTQLDKCLEEMDRFEDGDWFLDPVECKAFNKMRPAEEVLLNDISPVLDGFARTFESLVANGASSAPYNEAAKAQKQMTVLLQMYAVKMKQARAQTERVRKTESELAAELETLFKALEIESNSEQSDRP